MGNYRRCRLFCFLVLFGIPFLCLSEYAYVPVKLGDMSHSQFLDSQNVPDVIIRQRCNKARDKCWPILENHTGKQLKRFSSEDVVTEVALSRFQDMAYAVFERDYQCGDERCSDTLFMSSEGRQASVQSLLMSDPIAVHVGKNKQLLLLGSDEVLLQNLNGNRLDAQKTPEKIVDASIGMNVDGDYSIIAVAESGALYLGNGFSWHRLNKSLASRGDRYGVVSVYPKTPSEITVAIYHYVSAYSKGLYLVRYSTETDVEEGGWLFNSDERNIGFDPSVYYDNQNRLIVSATNSSEDESVHFSLTETDISKLPQYIDGDTGETLGSVMIGTGVSHLSWKATSKVEKNDVTYIDVDYDISDSLYTAVHAEARFLDYSITLNYLQNKAEDFVAKEIDNSGGTTSRKLSKEASSYLFSTIDLPGMLSPTSSLRILAEIGETNGAAQE